MWQKGEQRFWPNRDQRKTVLLFLEVCPSKNPADNIAVKHRGSNPVSSHAYYYYPPPLPKLIVFTDNEYENICMTGLNRRANYATEMNDDICVVSTSGKLKNMPDHGGNQTHFAMLGQVDGRFDCRRGQLYSSSWPAWTAQNSFSPACIKPNGHKNHN